MSKLDSMWCEKVQDYFKKVSGVLITSDGIRRSIYCEFLGFGLRHLTLGYDVLGSHPSDIDSLIAKKMANIGLALATNSEGETYVESLFTENAELHKALHFGVDQSDGPDQSVIAIITPPQLDSVADEARLQINSTVLLLSLLTTPLSLGCVISLSVECGVVTVDLNTQAKSHCILRVINGEILAYRRYDRVDKVTSLDDLMEIIRGCAHGKSYFSGDWLKVFRDLELEDPRL